MRHNNEHKSRLSVNFIYGANANLETIAETSTHSSVKAVLAQYVFLSSTVRLFDRHNEKKSVMDRLIS